MPGLKSSNNFYANALEQSYAAMKKKASAIAVPFSNYSHVPPPNPKDQLGLKDPRHSARGLKKRNTKRRGKKGSNKTHKKHNRTYRRR